MINLQQAPAAILSSPVEAPIIQLRNVVKSYKTAVGDFFALKGIDLEIYPGEFIGVLGKSGAGKSTLVNMVTGVDHLTSGEIWINNAGLHKMSENEIAVWRGRNMGVVYQSFRLMPTISILNNIMLPMDFGGNFRQKKSQKIALDLLREVELEDHAGKLPNAISGGQQQRVAIARALANDPAIIVADEPTGRLDSSTAETIMHIFENLTRQGKTILMVSHDMSLFERFSRVIWIADGKLTDEAQFHLTRGGHGAD